MGKRIFITGIAGFIGFHLARFLAARGDYVIGIDNFNEYYSGKLKQDRAAKLKSEGIEVFACDLAEGERISRLIQDGKISNIVHLAAQAGVRYSLQNPYAYVKSNLDGFLSILEVCRSRQDIPLVYASSSSVYGLNTKVPFSESDRTDNQASLYGVTKKADELMAGTYHHLFGISTVGLRFFTVYGPWGRPDMAYYSFTKNILEGRPIDIFNHGKMKRDFTYIDDIIRGVAASLELKNTNDIFNLGNNKPAMLMELVGILEDCLGKKAIIRELPMQQGDVLETFADIQHSSEVLGFRPQTPLSQGLRNFVEWYTDYHLS